MRFQDHPIIKLQEKNPRNWIMDLSISTKIADKLASHDREPKNTLKDYLFNRKTYKNEIKNLFFRIKTLDFIQRTLSKKMSAKYMINTIYERTCLKKDFDLFCMVEGGVNVLFSMDEDGLVRILALFEEAITDIWVIDKNLDDFVYFGGKTEDDQISFLGNNLFLVFFFCFADIKTKTIEHGKGRRVKINNQKYINDLKVPVSIIDESFYTNIIRTEGFNVSGHFRLQPVGEGRKERKLTWIQEFQKHGYRREAGKLKEQHG